MSKHKFRSQFSTLNSPLSILLVVILLLAMYAQMMGSVRVKSATYDEQTYYARGYAVLKTGDMRLRLRHPLLTNLISAAPLLLIPDLEVPTEHPSWANAEFHAFSAEFLWKVNREHADQIVYLARWPMMLLTLVLATFVYRWAKELFGSGGGLLALALTTLDPNLIAHGRLANTDIGSVAFIFIAAYAFWTYLHKPNWQRLILAGIACGLAQTTRFTALLLFPIFGLQVLVLTWREEGHLRWCVLERTLLTGLALVGLSLLVIWAVYGFTWGPVDGSGPSLPAPDHWGELLSLLNRLDRSDPAFLLGRIYEGGWWPYFFVALVVKTPIPTLILIGWATFQMARRNQWLRDMPLLLPVAAYFGTAVMGNLNIGYRLILPILPFLAVHAARLAQSPYQSTNLPICQFTKPLLLTLTLWLVISSSLIYPHYLAYFNEIIGPSNGYKVLVDSNLDWGQDLPGLQRWMDEHDVEQVYLSWFGIAPPEHYGVSYRYLPGWPPFEDRELRVYHPKRPLPGTYAISATHLQGVLLDDPDTFTYFRRRKPIAQVGHSILIYEVPATGPPVNLALGDVRFDQIPAQLLATQFKTNDLRLRWFDPASSLVLTPHQAKPCYAIAEDSLLAEPLAERLGGDLEPLPQMAGLRLRLCPEEGLVQAHLAVVSSASVLRSPEVEFAPGDAPEVRKSVPLPVSFEEKIAFLGYELIDPPTVGEEVSLLTYWRVQEQPDHPLKIFVHLLDDHSNIWGQQDSLGMPTAGWHYGDVFIQLHSFDIASNAPKGRYWLEIGLYNPKTMKRTSIVDRTESSVGNRLLLRKITIQ
jgi:hypothetical protein